MKALSIRAPWWLAILEWGKRIENRFWKAPISYRGPLLIHASAWWDDEGVQTDMAAMRAMAMSGRIPGPSTQCTWRDLKAYCGGIVGIARLTDCRWNRRSGDPWAIDQSPALPLQWRSTGALGLVLADPQPLPFVPLKGSLGLFEVTPETVLADTRRAKDGPEHRVAAESLIKLLNGGSL